jgi:hypothetical protein
MRYIDKTFSLSLQDINNINDDEIVWKRPKEITSDAQFIINGVDKSDVIQGCIGDCYLISAISCLSTKPYLLQQIMKNYDFNSKNYIGKLSFNIWDYGKWSKIVIDDRLPTINNKVIFSRSSNNNEFWCSLLEKAYAKFRGSYKYLEDGHINDTIVDFSGGISLNNIDLNDVRQNKTLKEKIKYQLLNTVSKNFLYGCYNISRLQNNICGIIENHAYSILDITEINSLYEKYLLIKLRNPWGTKEWNGYWSDKSDLWNSVSDEEKSRINFKKDDDGEFWILFDDFINIFDIIEGCWIYPIQSENLMIFSDEWKDKNICGNYGSEFFENNNQYLLEYNNVNDCNDVTIFSLLQKKFNDKNRQNGIVLQIFELENLIERPLHNDEIYSLKHVTNEYVCYIFKREYSVQFTNLNGKYIIIPSSMYNDENEFILRIFSNSKISIQKLTTN